MPTKSSILGVAAGGSQSQAGTPGEAIQLMDYRRLFLAVPTPVLVVGHATLQVVAVNPAATRALGFSEQELLASGFADLVSPEDRRALLQLPEPAPVPGLLEARSSWQVRRREGAWLRLEVASASVTFGGRPCAILFQPPLPEPTARDVGTSGASLPEFSFSALHDLKEPLHLIKGYLALLRARAGPGLDAESQEFLDYACTGTQRMQDIVLNLLEFFRVDARGVSPEPVNLDTVLAITMEGLRLQIQEAKAVVTWDPLPVVVADRLHVGRLLENLLSNAIKFRSGASPQVHVGARREGPLWDVWVKDNGIGIDPRDHERILQPFQRLHSSDRYPGTGLGLSICKKVAEMHGGRLWIESELGKGTEVHVTLPARTEA